MQKDCRCLLTHPGKCHPDVCTSSLSHSHLHRRGPLGAQSSPQGSGPAPARHHGPWSLGKTAGVWVDPLLCSAPGWRCNLPVVWCSPSHLRSPAGWPELCPSYLEGFWQKKRNSFNWIQKALLALHNKVHIDPFHRMTCTVKLLVEFMTLMMAAFHLGLLFPSLW